MSLESLVLDLLDDKDPASLLLDDDLLTVAVTVP